MSPSARPHAMKARYLVVAESTRLGSFIILPNTI
jgi:hypothetical protein